MFEKTALVAFYLGLSFAPIQSAGNLDAGTPPQASSPVLTPAERLHAAVRKSDLAEAATLIANGVDVNVRDASGSTPLLEAAYAGNVEMCQFLLQHGADVNAHNLETGSTALQYAVANGRVAVEKVLLSAGARTDARFHGQETLLHIAAARGNPQVVEPLLLAHADVTAADANENSPLDDAVMHGHLEVVNLLIAHGADAKRTHSLDGRGTLHEAAIEGFALLVQLLIRAGADPLARDRSGQTPLDLALAYKNGNVVAALLKTTVRAKELQQVAADAMESATMRGQTEIARVLIDSGFDITEPTAAGSTYLHDAALKGQKKMVELLLEHGARVDSLNRTGGTPLHDAALGGSPDVIAVLLDHGAAIDARDKEEEATPLMLAASLGRSKAVELLLARGANPALRDRSGHTALDRARETDDETTQKLLKAALAQSADVLKTKG